MKNVKTVLALVLALVMAMSLMACGNKVPTETSAAAAETVNEAAAETTAATDAIEEVPSVTQQDVPSVTQQDVPSVTQQNVPSVTQNDAPALDGSFVIREMAGEKINLDTDKVVAEVPAEALHVVGFNGRNEAAEDVKTVLENAYKAITEAENLAALSEDVTAAAEDCGLTVDQLAVRDLVDITLDEEYAKILADEKNYIVLTFGLDMAEDEAVFALHGLEDGTWETIFGENIIREEDGKVSVVFKTLSPVAVVVKSAE